MTDDSRIDVQVREAFAAAVPEHLIRRVVDIALCHGRQGGPDHVTVLITDDDTLRSLNRDFRGIDEVTDVLAFNARGGWRDDRPGSRDEEAFPLPPGEQDRLGDIAVSYPQAARQAEAADVPIDRELALLVAHGVLHLLGFGHSDPRREEAMAARTRSILADAFDC